MKKAKGTKKKSAKAGGARGPSGSAATDASRMIEARIAELGDWRGETLARVRKIVLAADRGVFEEWKWHVPVWSHPACGIVCTGEAYKSVVKLTFAKGASIADPKGSSTLRLKGRRAGRLISGLGRRWMRRG